MGPDRLVRAGLVLLGGGVAWFMIRRRARREAADSEALARVKQEGRTDAPTLHPIIDPDKCIGSLSCTAVCPEGDILGVVDGKAALINPAACIGPGKCSVACPVNAIEPFRGTARSAASICPR